jgi:tRNA(Ile)-lysidine synthase
VRREVSDVLLTRDWCLSLTHYQTLSVGFSGGLDSTVLLHAIAQQPHLIGKLQAIHVHHGLSANADAWQSHCQQFCKTLSVPLHVRNVQFAADANIEERARLARYQVFASLLAENDCLLLGHHADDQAETLLLQLFRGAGIDGMAAMASIGTLAKGVLGRPLLHHSRDELEAYAYHHQLTWVDDESNQNSAFSRNYLRHQIMPLLREKWPNVGASLARSASHCQQAKQNLEALAEIDYVELNKQRDQLLLQPLLILSPERLANVLRVWLKNNQVRYPSAIVLKRLMDDVIFAREDALPSIEWDGIVIRRYQQVLYLLKESASRQPAWISWSAFPAPLRLSEDDYLSASRCSSAEQGVNIPENSRVEIRFRQGGELFHWHGQTKQLKKLLQEWHIPPWQRDKIPLLYIDDELAAVVGFAISDRYYSKGLSHTYFIELNAGN